MPDALPQIKVLLITPAPNRSFTVQHLMIGPKPRHFAKRIVGDYDAELDSGMLAGAGLGGNSVSWRYNGVDDESPLDPRLSSWSLPGLDFMIWGPGIIYGVRQSKRVNTSVSQLELVQLLEAWNATRDRVSAALEACGAAARRATGRPGAA